MYMKSFHILYDMKSHIKKLIILGYDCDIHGRMELHCMKRSVPMQDMLKHTFTLVNKYFRFLPLVQTTIKEFLINLLFVSILCQA